MDALPTLCFSSASLGDLDVTDTVQVDLQRFISSRLLIQANSGGGKSRALRSLLEQTHGSIQQIVFDPEGEFASLREHFSYVLAGKEGGEVPTDPKTAKLLCRRLVELGVSAVIDLYDLSLTDRRRFVRLFIEELMNLPRDLWHPLLVVIDEAHVFCPERGAGEAESTEAVITLCTQGRKRGYCAVLATQRIAKLHKDAAAELLNKLIGRTGLDVDLRRAGDELGLDKEQRNKLRYLAPGSFFAFGPAIADGQGITLVRSAPVTTTHPEPGTVASPPPPAPDAIRALAVQFADFPREVEQEAENLNNARRRIVELEQQIRHVSTSSPSEVIHYVQVPVEVPVHVPILQNGELERIEYLVQHLAIMQKELATVAFQISLLSDTTGRKLSPIPTDAPMKQFSSADYAPLPMREITEKLQLQEPEPEENNQLSDPRSLPNSLHLSGPQQRIINSLASFAELGITHVLYENVASLAGQPVPSSGFASNLRQLQDLRLLKIRQDGIVLLTDEGHAKSSLPKRSEGRSTFHHWMSMLPYPQQRVMKEIIASYPRGIDSKALANKVGQMYWASGFKSSLAQLVSFTLLERKISRTGIATYLPSDKVISRHI